MNILIYLLVFLIPIGTRIFFGQVTSGFHEYEAMFIYGSDFVTLALIVVELSRGNFWPRFLSRTAWIALLIFICTALISIFFAPSFVLSGYNFIRLLILILCSLLIARQSAPVAVLRRIIATIAIVAVAQSVIGIVQFAKQGSIGLERFGEPALISYRGPSSTIHAAGGRFLRAYGTFPHPNVLAVFLVLGLCSLGYWYVALDNLLRIRLLPYSRELGHGTKPLKMWRIYAGRWFLSRHFLWRMLVAAGFFVVTLGLTLTFSRSGWIAATVGLLVLVLALARRSFGGPMRLALLALACGIGSYWLLAPIIAPRADISAAEPAVQDRLVYNRIGFEIARDNPFGVGIGNQVLYGVRDMRYAAHGLHSVWQWEPVHNLYLLMTDEIGWLGALSFLCFLGMVLMQLGRRVASPEAAVCLALLAALLVAGLFDHLLWDLQSGRLMLWLVIGLALSQLQNKKPSSFNG